MDEKTKAILLKNPNRFVVRVIKEFVRTSPLNRFENFEGPMWEEPLVAFAAGDDPLFNEFKRVVADTHLTPREALTLHVKEILKTETPPFESVSVISYVLPMPKETVDSNARETEGPSLRWNITRWKGQEFSAVLQKHIVALLEDAGYYAVAPEVAPLYKIFRTEGGFASNWSQRHAAYAAGLGTFSLSEGFITKKGIAHRLGSIITNLKLQPSPHPYTHHLANCRFYAKETCGECIARCPGGAISEKGHDKLKCSVVLFEKQKPWLEGAHGPGYIGRYAGCGLCQTGVPCEHRIPVSRKKRTKVPAY
ncbi:MAG: epoxyqueuosine reductase [Dehalococcoidia bacterium]|nr:epoxyqueuosine reductase [Dehalococcoidia bacterium]